MRDYIVFSKRLAKTLNKMGFETKAEKPNKSRPEYNVYYFADTAELRAAID